MKLLKCKACGKVVEIIQEGCPTINCCGEKMVLVEPNTVDAANEKHIPYTQIDENKVFVKIGEIEHPMEEKHYINFVVAEYENKQIKKYFKPGEKPETTFDYEKGMKIYSYCNLHGLWIKEL